MFKSITVDGKPIKRVVSNGQTIWRKAEKSFEYRLAERAYGADRQLRLDDFILMSQIPSPRAVNYIEIEGQPLIGGNYIDDFINNGQTIQLRIQLSDVGINGIIEPGTKVTVHLR